MIFFMDPKIDAIVIKKIILLLPSSWNIGRKSSFLRLVGHWTRNLCLHFKRIGFGYLVKWKYEIERKLTSEITALNVFVLILLRDFSQSSQLTFIWFHCQKITKTSVKILQYVRASVKILRISADNRLPPHYPVSVNIWNIWWEPDALPDVFPHTPSTFCACGASLKIILTPDVPCSHLENCVSRRRSKFPWEPRRLLSSSPKKNLRIVLNLNRQSWNLRKSRISSDFNIIDLQFGVCPLELLT
jgi:hypothetical protein